MTLANLCKLWIYIIKLYHSNQLNMALLTLSKILESRHSGSQSFIIM